MDFIERIFGISPDLGSGSLEFGLVALPLLACYLWWQARRSRKPQRS